VIEPPVSAILFDVDGTLFSSEEIIHEIYIVEFERARLRLGRPIKIPTKPEILEQIGKPVPTIFANLAPDLTRAEQDDVSHRILITLVEGILGGAGHHYEGVRETVRDLAARGYALFTASNGREAYVRAILKANEILDCFQRIPVLGGAIHDKNELVKSILIDSSLAPEEVILVGDRTSDRDAAIGNGVRFVACRFGHGSDSEWDGACVIIDRIQDLSGLIPPRGAGLLA